MFGNENEMSANQKLSPLLCMAKDEYVNQIADCIAPFVINVINTLYSAAKKNSGTFGGGFVKDFQKKLREIPLWNQSMIDGQVVAITNKHKYLPELIAAVFVSYVKILSSVKIHAHKPKISLKLPADDVFVHKVYTVAAKSFYMDPALVKAPRDVRMHLVRHAVETAVRELLPIEEILRAYLGGSVDDTGIQTNEIDDEEIDLSPTPEEKIVSPASAHSPDAASLSPVQALGDQTTAPSPAPSPFVSTNAPADSNNAEAIARLKDLLRKTEIDSQHAPLGQSTPPVGSPDRQQEVISVPTAPYRPAPGAFVSPLMPASRFGLDSSGDQFFS